MNYMHLTSFDIIFTLSICWCEPETVHHVHNVCAYVSHILIFVFVISLWMAPILCGMQYKICWWNCVFLFSSFCCCCCSGFPVYNASDSTAERIKEVQAQSTSPECLLPFFYLFIYFVVVVVGFFPSLVKNASFFLLSISLIVGYLFSLCFQMCVLKSSENVVILDCMIMLVLDIAFRRSDNGLNCHNHSYYVRYTHTYTFVSMQCRHSALSLSLCVCVCFTCSLFSCIPS